jgi:hypothetical protein
MFLLFPNGTKFDDDNIPLSKLALGVLPIIFDIGKIFLILNYS